MPTLLAIEVSPRHEFSTSRKLTALFIDRWKAARPGAAVVVRDLMRTPPPFVDLAWIGGAFTPREQHSPESAAAIKVSDDLIAELKAADDIVIGTPMFNFSIPAVLKAYIDQIVRVGDGAFAVHAVRLRHFCVVDVRIPQLSPDVRAVRAAIVQGGLLLDEHHFLMVAAVVVHDGEQRDAVMRGGPQDSWRVVQVAIGLDAH